MRVGTLLGIAVGLVACAEAPSPVAPLRTLDQTPAMSAATSSFSLTKTYSRRVWVSCANDGAGENVNISGELVILGQSTEDGNGGMHVTTHYRPSRVTGLGQVTGLKFKGVSAALESEQYAADGSPTVYTLVDNFRLIGQGPGNNILIHRTVHQTWNANGELTADVQLSSNECK